MPNKVPIPSHITNETKEWVQDTDQESLLNDILEKGKTLWRARTSTQPLLTMVWRSAPRSWTGRMVSKQFKIKSENKGGEFGKVYKGLKLKFRRAPR